MSITPTGGWGNPPRQDDSPASVGGWTRGSQPSSAPRSSYLSCKVCDRGTLSSKTVFRMSGPVVAIGFILLIPSILGIGFSALTLLGFNAVLTGAESGTNANDVTRPYQSEFDASFRKSCAARVRLNSQEMGTYTSQQTVEQVCECSLSAFKETGSATLASQTCSQKITEGTLEPLSPNVDEFYLSDIPRRASVAPDASLGIARVFGSGFIIFIGIASFVGGLLGWLLVMRKRVLQCDVCGAVVNAS
jgi:hypothetical protein